MIHDKAENVGIYHGAESIGNDAQIERVLAEKDAQIERVLAEKDAQIERVLAEKDAQISRLSMAALASPSPLLSSSSSSLSSSQALPEARPESAIAPPWIRSSTTAHAILLPLWRLSVDCPFGSALLCATHAAEYEHFNSFPKRVSGSCSNHTSASSSFSSSFLSSSAASFGRYLSVARARLTARLKPGAPPVASALTGRRPAATPPIAVSPSSSALPIGCGGAATGGGDIFRAQMALAVAKWRETVQRDGLPLAFTMTDQKYKDVLAEQVRGGSL